MTLLDDDNWRDQAPNVQTLDEARFWIQLAWRWSVQDSRRINELSERLRWLERPWWRRIWSRRNGV